MAVIGVLNTLVQADTVSYDKGVDKVGKGAAKMKADVAANSAGMAQAFNGMTSLSGLGGSLSNLSGRVTSTFGGMSSVISGAMGMAGAAIGLTVGVALAGAAVLVGFGVGLHALASRGSEAVLSMRTLSQELGITMQAMSQLGSFGGDGLARGMIHMQRGVEDGSQAMARALSKIGLDPSRLRGLAADQQLRLIASGFSQLQNQGERASVSMALFGRGGLEMIEDLRKGAAGLDQAAARAERFGQIITDAQADAVKAASKEWQGLGMAIDGIGKQAAVMFAPAWEAIGKVGGDLGAWLVGAFRQAMPYMEQFGAAAIRIFGPMWQAAKTIAVAVGDIFISCFPLIEQFGELFMAVMRTMFSIVPTQGMAEAIMGDKGVISAFADGIKAIIPWLKIGLEVATAFVEMIGDLARALWSGVWYILKEIGNVIVQVFDASGIAAWFNTINIGGASFKDLLVGGLAVAVVAIRGLQRTWEIVVDSIKLAWLTFIRTMITTLPTDMQRRLGALLPSLSMANINRDIDATRERARRGLGDFGADVRTQIGRWNFELGGGLLNVANQAVVAMAEALAPLEVGRTHAITGHEAALAGSERAFSLLNGTRGNEGYQRQAAEGIRDGNNLLRDIRHEMQAAPGIRRARL